jgi:hypothetical protein
MPMSLLSRGDTGQVDQLKGVQDGFGSWTSGAAFGITDIPASDPFVLVCQPLAALTLKPRQDT